MLGDQVFIWVGVQSLTLFPPFLVDLITISLRENYANLTWACDCCILAQVTCPAPLLLWGHSKTNCYFQQLLLSAGSCLWVEPANPSASSLKFSNAFWTPAKMTIFHDLMPSCACVRRRPNISHKWHIRYHVGVLQPLVNINWSSAIIFLLKLMFFLTKTPNKNNMLTFTIGVGGSFL